MCFTDMNKSPYYYVKAHYKTNMEAGGPAYKTIRENLGEISVGHDENAAIEFADWLFSQNSTQFVIVKKLHPSWEIPETVHQRYKLGFWLGMQAIGIQNKVNSFMEEQIKILNNLKAEKK